MKRFLSGLLYKKKPQKKLKQKSSDTLSDLLNRLKYYDPYSKSDKLDLLSIPLALQMILKLFPRKYCRNILLKRKILRTFVLTVIPGANEDDEYLTKMFEDAYYPFHTYCGYFVFDLNIRSKKLYNKEFTSLSPDERTRVIQIALTGRELTRRLYKGAILMAQVSYFGAIYNEIKGCRLIDFPGKNIGYKREKITYPFAALYFDMEATANGHPW